MGAARDLYITDLGEYTADIYGSSKHFLGSKTHTVSANETEIIWKENEDQILYGSDTEADDRFGSIVSIDGNYAVIGADNEDAGGSNAGAVYIFYKSGGTWAQQAKLVADNAGAGDKFGRSVSISGDYVVVSSPFEDTTASDSGSVYIFKRSGTTWSQQQQIQAGDAANSDFLGSGIGQGGGGIAIDNDYFIIGAVNNDDNGDNSGSAYIFKKTTTTHTGTKNPYFTDASTIVTDSNWSSSTGFEITASADAANQPGYHAFDNIYTAANSWESTWLSGSNSMPAWVQIQYPQDVVIKSYTIVGRDDTNRYYPTSWQLQGATAAAPSTYVNLETTSGNRTASSWAPLAEVSHDVNTPNTAYRYFRLYVNSSNENNQVSINELKLFTTPLSGQSATVDESWSQQSKLIASDAAASDQFGTAVTISGDYAIVGSPNEDTGGTDAGSAYIFKKGDIFTSYTVRITRNGDTSSTGTGNFDITPSDGNVTLRNWGNSPSAGQLGAPLWDNASGTPLRVYDDGTIILAGETLTTYTVGGSPATFYECGSGLGGTNFHVAITIVSRTTGTGWSQQQKIQASDPQADDAFGGGVSLSGDYLAVGARQEDTGGTDAGSVYIFKKASGSETWSQEAKLQASDVSTPSRFGMSVSLSGNTLAVGANAEDTGGSNAGAAYIFERSGTTWTEVKKITASDTQASDYFGESISTDGTTTFVGAWGEDTKGSNAGAAYMFEKGAKAVPTLNFDGYNKLSIDNLSSDDGGDGPTDNDKLPRASASEREIAAGNWTPHYDYIYEAQSSPTGFYRFKICAQSASTPSNPTSDKSNTHTNNRHSILYEISTGKWYDGSPNADPNYITTTSTYASESVTTAKPAQIWTWNGTTLNDSYVLSSLSWSQPPPDDSSTYTIKKDGVAFATTTSNTVYIRDTGTYTAEVQGSGAYVTEVSKVVSGDITEFPNYVNATSFYYGGGVVDNTGKLYTWGHNGYGDSGRGASDRIPTAISTISDPVSNVWRGDPGITMAAKTSTDKWYMWGRNTYSAVLGNTTNTGNVTVPEDVTAKVTTYFGDQTVSANKILKIVMGSHHAAALTAGGKVWSWGGDNTYYATGTGTNNNTVLVTPVLLTITPMPPTSGQTGYEINATLNSSTTVKIRANGSTFTFNSQTCWYYDRLAGSNNTWYTQQLGYVPSTNTFIEASISGNPDQVYHNKTSSNVTKGSITVPPEGILLSNDASSWNGAALFANPFTSTQDSGHLTGITDIQSMFHGTAAFDSSGNVWFWGGSNTSMQYAYPTKLLDSSSIPGVVGMTTNGQSIYAWKSDGTFYTRGAGNYGQLANGADNDQYTSWQTVTTLQGKTIKKVFGGNENIFAWTDDGVYGVGRNNNYKLGEGSLSSRRNIWHKSTTLSALSIKEIDFGHATGLVLTTDGKGYMWGEDASNSMANALSGHQSGAAEATSISALSLVHIPSPSITYDGKNKLTVSGTNYADTSTVTYYSNTYNLGTAKTMYVKDVGEYVFKISGTDKYVDSNVYVSSVDLAGATTKPISFDGYNKLTLISPGANAVSNVTLGATTYDMGSASTFYIKDQGTYDLEMSGSNVFALSSNVVGSITQNVYFSDSWDWTSSSSLTSSDTNTTLTSSGSPTYDSSGGYYSFDTAGEYFTLSKNSISSQLALNVNDMVIDFEMYNNDGAGVNYFKFGGNSNARRFYTYNGNQMRTIRNGYNAEQTQTNPSYLAWARHTIWFVANTLSYKYYKDGTLIYTYTYSSAADSYMRDFPFHFGYHSIDSGSSAIEFRFRKFHYELSNGRITESLIANPDWYGLKPVPSLTFDNYNKLTVSNFTTTDTLWPPSDGTWSISTDTSTLSEWTISGASYGNGSYKAASSVATNGIFRAYQAFEGTEPGNTSSWQIMATAGILSIELPEPVLINKYALLNRNYNLSEDQDASPKDFTFEGSSDGSTWVVLDTVTGNGYYTAEGTASQQTFTMSNTTAYKHYRLNVTTINGGSAMVVGELKLLVNNPRTAKLTDPNGSTYALGQTQDTIYIKDTGNYTLDVRNNDQKAIVGKTVTGITQNTASSPYTITTDSLFFNYEAWNYSGSGNWLNQVNTANNPGVFPSSITYNSTSPKSFVFNNSNTERINIGNVNLQQTWTLECWAKFSDPVSSAGLFGHGIGGNNTGLHINIYDSGGKSRFGFYQNDVDATFSFQADTWYHLVYTYNNSGTSRQIYINGVLQTLGTFGSSYGSNYARGTDEFSIGNTYSPGSNGTPMKGEIAVARMYTKVLTVEEIGVNYAAGYLGTGATSTTPSLNFDTYNKLTVANVDSDATSNIDFFSNTYEMGSRKELIINDAGTYHANIYSSNTLALVKKEIITESGAKKVAFHHGAFSASDYSSAYSTVEAAATAGHVYSDTSTTPTYTWGTLGTISSTSTNTTYTWTPASTGFNKADILMVAGGGGGSKSSHSYSAGAGGGAGGLVYKENQSISGAQTIIVGNGGASGNGGTDGQNTTALGFTALGGGGGATSGQDGNNGGSGGGGDGSSSTNTPITSPHTATIPFTSDSAYDHTRTDLRYHSTINGDEYLYKVYFDNTNNSDGVRDIKFKVSTRKWMDAGTGDPDELRPNDGITLTTTTVNQSLIEARNGGSMIWKFNNPYYDSSWVAPNAGGSASQPSHASGGFGNSGGQGGGAQTGGGGGGGAGSVGQDGNTATGNGGNGGDGKMYSISGSNVYYAGGGGAGTGTGGSVAGTGGQGGGGNGGQGNGGNGGNGSSHTGGGGGGSNKNSTAGNGGTGIVIIKSGGIVTIGPETNPFVNYRSATVSGHLDYGSSSDRQVTICFWGKIGVDNTTDNGGRGYIRLSSDTSTSSYGSSHPFGIYNAYDSGNNRIQGWTAVPNNSVYTYWDNLPSEYDRSKWNFYIYTYKGNGGGGSLHLPEFDYHDNGSGTMGFAWRYVLFDMADADDNFITDFSVYEGNKATTESWRTTLYNSGQIGGAANETTDRLHYLRFHKDTMVDDIGSKDTDLSLSMITRTSENLPGEFTAPPSLTFDGYNKLTAPVLDASSTGTRLSDWDNSNQSKTIVANLGDWPESTAGITEHNVLQNGDKSYQKTSGGTGRDSAQLFTTVISGDWANASHGANGTHSPMTWGYKFTTGAKLIAQMILTQPPSASHTAGNVTIKYWDGSAMVTVSNQSPTGMSSQSYNSSTTFTFDSVSAQYWQIDCYKGSSNGTTYTGIHGWQLLSGRDPVTTVLTKGSDSYDIGTASSIYIDAAGTYDAQAKNSNTFIIKTSNVVSGSITRSQVWNATETQILLASDRDTNTQLGYGCDIDGDYIIGGGPQDDEEGSAAGAAYIFYKSGGTWTQQAKLTASDPNTNDQFGEFCEISGDYAIVGNYQEDAGGTSAGAAYVYKRDGTTWTQQAKLTASDAATNDYFGWGVSISGDYAIVGAYGEDTGGEGAGAAYIFKRSGASWSQQAKIVASDAATTDQYGWDVSISGDYAVVGARQEDEGGSNAGAAYIFKYDATYPPDDLPPVDSVGTGFNYKRYTSLDTSTHYVYKMWRNSAGDWRTPSPASANTIKVLKTDSTDWSNNDTTDTNPEYIDTTTYSGKVSLGQSGPTENYRFSVPTFGRWSQQQKLIGESAGNYFGNAVAIDGDYLAVGAQYEATTATGGGAVYIFKRGTTSLNTVGHTIPDEHTAYYGASDWICQSVSGTVGIYKHIYRTGTPVDSGLNTLQYDSSTSTWSDHGTGQPEKFTKNDTNWSNRSSTVTNVQAGDVIRGWKDNTNAQRGQFTQPASGNIDIWSQEAKLLPSDGQANDELTIEGSLSISGDIVIAGARKSDPGGISNAGAAYVWERSGTTWTETKKFISNKHITTDGRFANSVGVSGDTVVVGAGYEDVDSVTHAGCVARIR